MSGERRRRRDRFFADNPRCCFCAGEAAAVEEDHQPGRVFFRNREWPEGFVYPACSNCNRASREAEQLTSLLVADTSDPRNVADYRKRLASIRHNYPKVVPRLLAITTNKKREVARAAGLAPPEGQPYADLPIVALDRGFWEPHLTCVARKILLGLHYQAFREPLSRAGRVWLHIMTNAQQMDQEWLTLIRDLAPLHVVPARSKQLLGDQLALRWGASTEPRMAMFMVSLQKMFYVVGLTTEVPDAHGFPDGQVFAPFSWPPIDDASGG